MKIGEYTFKRKYTLALIIVDIVSAVVLIGFGLIISAHIEWAQWFERNNKTEYVLNKDWYPLLIWVAAALAVTGVSIFLLLKSRKQPKKLHITKNNVVKYCSAVDAGISCIRLMLLLMLWNICSIHSDFILWGRSDINYLSFVIGAVIIAGIIALTGMRVSSISDAEAEQERKNRHIVEN
mgnify:CR=1 FL=1